MKLKDRTKESIISFETAKLAKELGFNEDCSYYWNTSKHNDITGSDRHWLDQFKNDRGYPDAFYNINEFKAPEQSSLQKWIRENHDIHIYVIAMKYGFRLFVSAKGNRNLQAYTEEKCFYVTYEQALEDGLKKALEKIKSVKPRTIKDKELA